MLKSKTAILLLNVGTPESPEISKVRKYLTEFLDDKRVIDIQWFLRKILVSFIIPFRAGKSAKRYQSLWTKKGSPLLFYGISLKEKLQQKAGDDYIVEFATNYQQPNIKEITDKILKSFPILLRHFPKIWSMFNKTTPFFWFYFPFFLPFWFKQVFSCFVNMYSPCSKPL